MTDLSEMTVLELEQAIRARSVSPVEALQASLRKIDEQNARLNAVVFTDAERAMQAATAAEREISAGRWNGPFHGVPILHKDLFQTRGMPTTAGSNVLRDFVPDQDAKVVTQMAQAGAVLVGKTNTHEFAYGPTNEVSAFGPVRNPWDITRISGGSSGGSAAAVCAGMVPLATGSDTGGSIRIPAACCGVSGLKPTYGAVSRAGIIPLCWSMDHAGPIARTAIDLALFMSVASTCPISEQLASPETIASPGFAMSADELKGLRIGIPRAYFYERAQEGVAAAVETALQVFEAAGAEVLEVDIPEMEKSAAAALVIYLAEALAYHETSLREHATLYSDQVKTFLEVGEQVLACDYIRAQRFRAVLGERLASLMAQQIDFLAMPTIAITPTKLGNPDVFIRGSQEAVFGAILRNTEPFNLTGLPALALPCGLSPEGLPISLQVVGPAFSDARLLRLGAAFQKETDWHLARPPAVGS